MLWLSWIFIILGIWLVLSPIVLVFSDGHALWNNIIIGIMIIISGFLLRNYARHLPLI
jgi:hypothetical protein